VELVQTDKGAEFQSAFRWHVLDRGIKHVYIKPATPRLNGKVERSHRIDDDDFYRKLEGVVVDDTQLFNTKLQEWEHSVWAAPCADWPRHAGGWTELEASRN
jgi:transposase InsO family protein